MPIPTTLVYHMMVLRLPSLAEWAANFYDGRGRKGEDELKVEPITRGKKKN